MLDIGLKATKNGLKILVEFAVSILVMLDIGLKGQVLQIPYRILSGFNPCYVGYRSESILTPKDCCFCKSVSILVMLDIGLKASL